MGMDVGPFSFGTEKVKVREGDKIMVKICGFEEMGIFHQVGIFRMLPEQIQGILWFCIEGGSGFIVCQGIQKFKAEQMPSVLFKMDFFPFFLWYRSGKDFCPLGFCSAVIDGGKTDTSFCQFFAELFVIIFPYMGFPFQYSICIFLRRSRRISHSFSSERSQAFSISAKYVS